MITVNIKPPRLPAGALSNLVGLAGLLLAAVAVGALFGNWWVTALIVAVQMVALSWVAHTWSAAAAAPAIEQPPAEQPARHRAQLTVAS